MRRSSLNKEEKKIYRRLIYINFKKYYINGSVRICNVNLYALWNNFMYDIFISDLNTKQIIKKHERNEENSLS